MNLANTFRTILATFAFAAFALTATASFADEAKVPTTAAEHEALAKQYKDQAAQYKEVAASTGRWPPLREGAPRRERRREEPVERRRCRSTARRWQPTRTSSPRTRRRPPISTPAGERAAGEVRSPAMPPIAQKKKGRC